jgi:hypothetical protein
MGEELTTQELMDLRIILVHFMADKEAHKKIPRLERRAPKLWDKVDRMYKYKQKRTKIGAKHIYENEYNHWIQQPVN